jgi:hypothetical protein
MCRSGAASSGSSAPWGGSLGGCTWACWVGDGPGAWPRGGPCRGALAWVARKDGGSLHHKRPHHAPSKHFAPLGRVVSLLLFPTPNGSAPDKDVYRDFLGAAKGLRGPRRAFTIIMRAYRPCSDASEAGSPLWERVLPPTHTSSERESVQHLISRHVSKPLLYPPPLPLHRTGRGNRRAWGTLGLNARLDEETCSRAGGYVAPVAGAGVPSWILYPWTHCSSLCLGQSCQARQTRGPGGFAWIIV